MQITKLEHSGIIIDKDGKKLVFDPVEFATTLPVIEDVAAIIITHAHGDHLQPEKIKAILDVNPTAQVFVPQDALTQLPNATVVTSGEIIEIEGFQLEFFGQDHAIVMGDQAPCDNIGVIVDGKIVNPGDSFDLPNTGTTIDVLLVPEAAPWSKISETVDYIKTAKPHIVVPVHDGILSEMGKTIYDKFLRNVCETDGGEFAALNVGDSIEV